MMSVDDMADDVTRANVNRRKQARVGAWRRVTARGGSWRRVATRDQPYKNFERRVGVRAVSDDVESFTVL